ncbi:MAG TPA: SDR family NAD(P)-dependent oxidoreductase [Puia sp.]|jgi:NAD(P)-dependent dehydrogenase (short-subunit alcohol dehydrogenase family)|nr:SDR family NAD(P)-dependent oxidoreductase [Puia sp.]
MARIFITGSADGLGSMTAKLLVSQGHLVVLHARNAERGRQAMSKVAGAEKVLIADLSYIEETKKLATEVNSMGVFDAVIHNAGVYNQNSGHTITRDFQQMMVNINTLAPYILTCLIHKPKRLIYISSGTHSQGDPGLKILTDITKLKGVYQTYSDTKLHDLILCMAVARRWPDVYANAVDPGWVPTKMGGAGATDDLEKGFQTQAWLAVSNDDHAKLTGHYFYHQKQKYYLPASGEVNIQDKFLVLCERITGVRFPADQAKHS